MPRREKWIWRENSARNMRSQNLHQQYKNKLKPSAVSKIWGVHGGDYEECSLLGYKTQFVLHMRHITSPLQSLAS
jgi:hypothetical protein